MWPWEHAIVGYLCYSVLSHVVYRDAPDGLEAFAVVFASLLPDLVDKPLAWEYAVFDVGYAIGHSIFVAVPLSIVVGFVAREADRPRSALAFGLGYLLHFPADVVDAYVREDVFQPELMLWPVATATGGGTEQGFFDTFLRFFARYQHDLLAGDLPTYLRIQLAVAAVAALLWLYDGAPVLRECLSACKRLFVGRDRSLEDTPNRR